MDEEDWRRRLTRKWFAIHCCLKILKAERVQSKCSLIVHHRNDIIMLRKYNKIFTYFRQHFHLNSYNFVGFHDTKAPLTTAPTQVKCFLSLSLQLGKQCQSCYHTMCLAHRRESILCYIDRQIQTQTQTRAPTVDGKKRQLTTSNNNNNKAKIIISIICSSIIIIIIICSISSIFSTNILWSSLHLFTSLDFWRCHLPFLLHFVVVVLVRGAQLVLVGIGRRGRTSSFL